MSEDQNPFDSDNLSPEEKLRNVARCVLQYTEVKHRRSLKSRRPTTYAADVDGIAGAARQLAEEVIKHLDVLQQERQQQQQGQPPEPPPGWK